MRNIFLTLLLIGLSGCTTTEFKETEKWEKLPDDFPVPPKKSKTPVDHPPPSGVTVDLDGLQSKLGMSRGPHTLGFREKDFNTCNVGNGYSSSDDCHQEYLVVVHFQLLCRSTDGTVSEVVTPDDTTAIANQSLKWNLGKLAGLARTDREGYGQIRTTSTLSQRESRLRLTLDDDFLFLRAGEITRVVAPKQWCR